jgi:ATP-dependent Zn protease
MVGSLGLAGRMPLLYRGGAKETTELLSYDEVRVDAHAELEKATDACRSLLTENLEALRKVVAILEERGRIDGATVADIIAGQCASWSGL